MDSAPGVHLQQTCPWPSQSVEKRKPRVGVAKAEKAVCLLPLRRRRRRRKRDAVHSPYMCTYANSVYRYGLGFGNRARRARIKCERSAGASMRRCVDACVGLHSAFAFAFNPPNPTCLRPSSLLLHHHHPPLVITTQMLARACRRAHLLFMLLPPPLPLVRRSAYPSEPGRKRIAACQVYLIAALSTA